MTLSPKQIANLLAAYEAVPSYLAEIPPEPANAPRETIAGPGYAPRGAIDARIVPRGAIPYIPAIDWSIVHEKLAVYLELILKWNARTNLSAIRNPDQVVQRHFGESIFTGLVLQDSLFVPRGAASRSAEIVPRGTSSGLAQNVPRGTTLLDFGSGAGFPGLPIQLLYPTLHVTLAESQGKKVAFLRETIRVLELPTEVWPRRVELMAAGQVFDAVAMRAVDDMDAAVREALTRTRSTLAILTTGSAPQPGLPSGAVLSRYPIPNSSDRTLLLATF